MNILVIDNYDSFTYNLVHIIRELGYSRQLKIFRNDKIEVEEVAEYDKILLSPGPGIPEEAGIMLDVIREYGPSKSILGVCLGHQGIGEVYGARLYNMPVVFHGVQKTTHIITDISDYIYKDLPNKFQVCRYHSWSVESASVNGDLEITSVDDEGIVMGIQHKKFDVRGVQFHPESVITEHGKKMIENWIKH